MYGAAFNHLDRDALLTALESLDWCDPLGVQVVSRSEDDDCWGVWMMVDGRFTELPLLDAVRVPPFGDDDRRDSLVRRAALNDASQVELVRVYRAGDQWRYVIFADATSQPHSSPMP